MGSFADEGEEEDPPQIIEVRELIDGMVELFTPIAERKGVKLNTEGPDDVFISVKLTLISAILRNLIQNAIKFSHKGGNVNLVWTTGGKRVGIFVQDEGVGIAKETQTKLFEVGYCKSTRGTDNEVGSGFGLQLCASLAKAIGSELVFESEPGAGSTFSLEMPAWLVEAANAV
jgi:signal transduction histidine kinase